MTTTAGVETVDAPTNTPTLESEGESAAAGPGLATILLSMKIPAAMVNSGQLRDFLVEKAERGRCVAAPDETLELLNLVIASHLEVLNALGALEEGLIEEMDTADLAYEEFSRNIATAAPDDGERRGLLGFFKTR